MDKFAPTWRELLQPVLLPLAPIPRAHCSYGPPHSLPEPPSFVHLGIRILEPTEDFNEKLHVVLNEEILYEIYENYKESSNEFHLKAIFEPNFEFDLLPDSSTVTVSVYTTTLKQNCNKCLKKVLQKIPNRELVEHGIIIQTYRINGEEFKKSFYHKRVNEVFTEFLTRTVIYNNYIRNDNVMQVFLYEGYMYLPGRLFTKFSTNRCKGHIKEILDYFIGIFHLQNEIEQIIELLFLEHYNLSPTIHMTLKSSLIESLRQRPFFRGINLFMQSPSYSSATHGLQRLCRKKILMCLLQCHAKFLALQLQKLTPLTAEQENKICDIFLQTCMRVLSLDIMLKEW